MVDGTTLAVLISASASACVALVSQIQHSRCTKIDLFYGCFKCDRSLEPEAAVATDSQSEPVELQQIEREIQKKISADITNAQQQKEQTEKAAQQAPVHQPVHQPTSQPTHQPYIPKWALQ